MKKVFWLIISTIIIISIIDIILIFTGMPTISYTILVYSYKKHFPFFPYFFGVLTGHFFIPNIGIKYLNKKTVLQILSCIVVLIPLLFITIHPIMVVAIGITAGAFLWGQSLD